MFRTAAVIDHFSKLVPHAEWYATEQIATLEACLKQAILKRGLPDAIYVDNGAVYRADQFAFACAHLGITLRHSKPYESEGRGAIERWNRTVVEQFESEIRALRLDDHREIQLRFEAWLEQRYHLGPRGHGQAPLDRFAQYNARIRPSTTKAPIRGKCRRQRAGASLRFHRSADCITVISARPECRGISGYAPRPSRDGGRPVAFR
jgi:transposase InsO family protein